MDISSIYGSSALDSTAYTNAANQTASKLQNQLNGSDYTKATDDELMDACRYYFEQTGRRITFEYSLVGGVNDTKEDAEELIALAKPLCCHVNLIPVNPIKERDYVQSDTKHIQAFKNKLESKKIHVTIRREMGRDIDGACGQLRRRHTQEAKNPGELSQEEV